MGQKAQWKRQCKKVGRTHTLGGGSSFYFWLKQERRAKYRSQLGSTLGPDGMASSMKDLEAWNRLDPCNAGCMGMPHHAWCGHTGPRTLASCSAAITALKFLIILQEETPPLHFCTESCKWRYLVLDTRGVSRCSVDAGRLLDGESFCWGEIWRLIHLMTICEDSLCAQYSARHYRR